MPFDRDVPSPITTGIDFAADGTQHGFLNLPWSRDDSAWGAILIPIAVIGRGTAPAMLLTGGNHGDEYEGPIALFDLARTLDPAEMTGRVIILPALNYPAFRAGTRTSPIDRGNLNRSFPGDPKGGPTAQIADYLTRYLLPLADVVLDFHSGGRTLDFLPYAAFHELPDKEQEARALAAVASFAAPWSMMMREIDAAGMLDTTAERLGKVFITTELGGGGTARVETVAIARRGVRNLLRHAGILAGAPDPAPTRWLTMPSAECFHIAEDEGLVEPCIALGERVRAGAVIARIHPIGRTGLAPSDQRAAIDGLLAARHVPGLVHPGDCHAVIATEIAVPRRYGSATGAG
ncbi:MAG: N(2)-acetyl-L-2,4-diaminobutanoate deacetylase DoeB [Acetobacteraceae bacterium]